MQLPWVDFKLVGKDILQSPEEYYQLEPAINAVVRRQEAMETDELQKKMATAHGYRPSKQDDTDSEISEEPMEIERPLPEGLAPEDVIETFSDDEMMPIWDQPDWPTPFSLVEMQDYPLADLVKLANGGQGVLNRKALAYLLLDELRSGQRATARHGVSMLYQHMGSLGIQVPIEQQFEAIATFVPMSKVQLTQLMSGKLLSSYGKTQPEYLKEFIRCWVSQGKSYTELFKHLTKCKVPIPSEANVGKKGKWDDDKFHALLPGLTFYYESFSEEQLEDLHKRAAEKDSSAAMVLLDMARLQVEAGTKHYILSVATRLQKGLGEVVSNLNARKLLVPPGYKEKWKSEVLGQYIYDRFTDEELQKYSFLPAVAQVLITRGSGTEIKQSIYRQIQEEGPSISLMNRLNGIKAPNPFDKTWNTRSLGKYLKQNFPYKNLFPRSLKEVYDEITTENYVHSAENIELVIRAQWGRPGALEAILAKYNELGTDPESVAQHLNLHGLTDKKGQSWTTPSAREAMELAEPPL